MKRYAEANKELVRKGKQKDRVVFMGNSSTEGWVANEAAFFEDNGYEMCIRDRVNWIPIPLKLPSSSEFTSSSFCAGM